MDLNTIKMMIENEMAKGEDIKAILDDIAVVANDIIAERAEQERTEELKKTINAGSLTVIQMLAERDSDITAEDMVLIELAFLKERTSILDDIAVEEVFDKTADNLEDMLAAVETAMPALNAIKSCGDCEAKCVTPKTFDLGENDNITDFLKNIGLI